MKKILLALTLIGFSLNHVMAEEHHGGNMGGPRGGGMERHEFHGGGGGFERHEFHGGGPAYRGGYGYRSGYGYYPYYGGYYYDTFGNFIVPSLIGGMIGYELAQPRDRTVIVQQPPVVIQGQAPADNAPPGYHTEAIKDAACNCYRNVLIQNPT